MRPLSTLAEYHLIETGGKLLPIEVKAGPRPWLGDAAREALFGENEE